MCRIKKNINNKNNNKKLLDTEETVDCQRWERVVEVMDEEGLKVKRKRYS